MVLLWRFSFFAQSKVFLYRFAFIINEKKIVKFKQADCFLSVFHIVMSFKGIKSIQSNML
jgi:hypothetical protein